MSMIEILLLISLLLLSFFLNYFLSLCSNINLFNVDLTSKKNDKEEEKIQKQKVSYIIKNYYLLFVINYFFQSLFVLTISEIINVKTVKIFFDSELTLPTKIFYSFIISIPIIIFTEFLSRYFSNKKISEKIKFSNLFLNSAYTIARGFSWLKVIVKPKEKLFTNNEQDAIRFIQNLTVDNIIEHKEAQLVKAAFNFDELEVEEVMTPWKKTVFLTDDMTNEEVKKIYLNCLFNRYPVLNEKKQMIGTFNYSMFSWSKLKNEEDISWKYFIIEQVLILPKTKLNKSFEELQKENSKIGIVWKDNNFIGIITLSDIMMSLLGRVSNEREKFRIFTEPESQEMLSKRIDE